MPFTNLEDTVPRRRLDLVRERYTGILREDSTLVKEFKKEISGHSGEHEIVLCLPAGEICFNLVIGIPCFAFFEAKQSNTAHSSSEEGSDCFVLVAATPAFELRAGHISVRNLSAPCRTKPIAKSCRVIGRRRVLGAFDDKGRRRVAEGCRTEGACDRVCGEVVYLPENYTLFNTLNSVSPSERGRRVAREESSPFWSKGEGIPSPYDYAFGNVRCGDHAFPLLLVEVFHPEGETFFCTFERIEAVEKFTGRGFKSAPGVGGWIFDRVGQTEALDDFPCSFFAHEPSQVVRQQQHVEFWAVARSESEGKVRATDIPSGKPRLDFSWQQLERTNECGNLLMPSLSTIQQVAVFIQLAQRVHTTLRIRSHLDKRLRSYASYELLMRGEIDLLKREAFFRPLLAFRLTRCITYEIYNFIPFAVTHLSLGCGSSTWHHCNTISPPPEPTVGWHRSLHQR